MKTIKVAVFEERMKKLGKNEFVDLLFRFLSNNFGKDDVLSPEMYIPLMVRSILFYSIKEVGINLPGRSDEAKEADRKIEEKKVSACFVNFFPEINIDILEEIKKAEEKKEFPEGFYLDRIILEGLKREKPEIFEDLKGELAKKVFDADFLEEVIRIRIDNYIPKLIGCKC